MAGLWGLDCYCGEGGVVGEGARRMTEREGKGKDYLPDLLPEENSMFMGGQVPQISEKKRKGGELVEIVSRAKCVICSSPRR